MEKKPEEILLDLSETEEARIQAAFKLENRFDKVAIEAFKKAIKTEPSPIVRHEIAFSMGETGSKELVNPLIEAMENDPHIFVRHEATLALGTLGKKEAVPHLKKILKCGIPEIEESAKIALQRINS
ncbi:HEAT repeat domain-containing protein [Candidatus Woesearchaeota archaeon]|nr:HEAT repeat domain-containing protein [Candidatus Woesearchaeota archaeon]